MNSISQLLVGARSEVQFFNRVEIFLFLCNITNFVCAYERNPFNGLSSIDKIDDARGPYTVKSLQRGLQFAFIENERVLLVAIQLDLQLV